MEHLVGLGLFQRGQVLSLQVFQDGHFHHLALVKLADDGRNGGLAGQFRSPEAPLAGNDLIAAHGPADDDWLQDPVFLDGFRQFAQLFFIEILPRLVGVGPDLFQREVFNLLGRLDLGLLFKESAQAPTQAPLLLDFFLILAIS